MPAPGRFQWGWLSSDRCGLTSFRDDSSRVLGVPFSSQETWQAGGSTGQKVGYLGGSLMAGTLLNLWSMCWEPYVTTGVLSFS